MPIPPSFNGPSIGQQIKDYRRLHGLSQTEFANLVGVTRHTISAWELGSNEPTREMMVRIRNILGLPSDFGDGLGGRLLQYRSFNRLSMEQMGQILGITEVTYRRLELNQVSPSTQLLNSINILLSNPTPVTQNQYALYTGEIGIVRNVVQTINEGFPSQGNLSDQQKAIIQSLINTGQIPSDGLLIPDFTPKPAPLPFNQAIYQSLLLRNGNLLIFSPDNSVISINVSQERARLGPNANIIIPRGINAFVIRPDNTVTFNVPPTRQPYIQLQAALIEELKNIFGASCVSIDVQRPDHLHAIVTTPDRFIDVEFGANRNNPYITIDYTWRTGPMFEVHSTLKIGSLNFIGQLKQIANFSFKNQIAMLQFGTPRKLAFYHRMLQGLGFVRSPIEPLQFDARGTGRFQAQGATIFVRPDGQMSFFNENDPVSPPNLQNFLTANFVSPNLDVNQFAALFFTPNTSRLSLANISAPQVTLLNIQNHPSITRGITKQQEIADLFANQGFSIFQQQQLLGPQIGPLPPGILRLNINQLVEHINNNFHPRILPQIQQLLDVGRIQYGEEPGYTVLSPQILALTHKPTSIVNQLSSIVLPLTNGRFIIVPNTIELPLLVDPRVQNPNGVAVSVASITTSDNPGNLSSRQLAAAINNSFVLNDKFIGSRDNLRLIQQLVNNGQLQKEHLSKALKAVIRNQDLNATMIDVQFPVIRLTDGRIIVLTPGGMTPFIAQIPVPPGQAIPNFTTIPRGFIVTEGNRIEFIRNISGGGSVMGPLDSTEGNVPVFPLANQMNQLERGASITTLNEVNLAQLINTNLKPTQEQLEFYQGLLNSGALNYDHLHPILQSKLRAPILEFRNVISPRSPTLNVTSITLADGSLVIAAPGRPPIRVLPLGINTLGGVNTRLVNTFEAFLDLVELSHVPGQPFFNALHFRNLTQEDILAGLQITETSRQQRAITGFAEALLQSSSLQEVLEAIPVIESTNINQRAITSYMGPGSNTSIYNQLIQATRPPLLITHVPHATLEQTGQFTEQQNILAQKRASQLRALVKRKEMEELLQAVIQAENNPTYNVTLYRINNTYRWMIETPNGLIPASRAYTSAVEAQTFGLTEFSRTINSFSTYKQRAYDPILKIWYMSTWSESDTVSRIRGDRFIPPNSNLNIDISNQVRGVGVTGPLPRRTFIPFNPANPYPVVETILPPQPYLQRFGFAPRNVELLRFGQIVLSANRPMDQLMPAIQSPLIPRYAGVPQFPPQAATPNALVPLNPPRPTPNRVQVVNVPGSSSIPNGFGPVPINVSDTVTLRRYLELQGLTPGAIEVVIQQVGPGGITPAPNIQVSLRGLLQSQNIFSPAQMNQIMGKTYDRLLTPAQAATITEALMTPVNIKRTLGGGLAAFGSGVMAPVTFVAKGLPSGFLITEFLNGFQTSNALADLVLDRTTNLPRTGPIQSINSNVLNRLLGVNSRGEIQAADGIQITQDFMYVANSELAEQRRKRQQNDAILRSLSEIELRFLLMQIEAGDSPPEMQNGTFFFLSTPVWSFLRSNPQLIRDALEHVRATQRWQVDQQTQQNNQIINSSAYGQLHQTMIRRLFTVRNDINGVLLSIPEGSLTPEIFTPGTNLTLWRISHYRSLKNRITNLINEMGRYRNDLASGAATPSQTQLNQFISRFNNIIIDFGEVEQKAREAASDSILMQQIVVQQRFDQYLTTPDGLTWSHYNDISLYYLHNLQEMLDILGTDINADQNLVNRIKDQIFTLEIAQIKLSNVRTHIMNGSPIGAQQDLTSAIELMTQDNFINELEQTHTTYNALNLSVIDLFSARRGNYSPQFLNTISLLKSGRAITNSLVNYLWDKVPDLMQILQLEGEEEPLTADENPKETWPTISLNVEGPKENSLEMIFEKLNWPNYFLFVSKPNLTKWDNLIKINNQFVKGINQGRPYILTTTTQFIENDIQHYVADNLNLNQEVTTQNILTPSASNTLTLTQEALSQDTWNFVTPGDFVWTCPSGVTSVYVMVHGGGGKGGAGWTGSGDGGSGGGGGGGALAYGIVPVVAGNEYSGFVGDGANNKNSYFTGEDGTIAANGGQDGSNGVSLAGGVGGVGGTTSIGGSIESLLENTGGNGFMGEISTEYLAGGGGGGAGFTNVGSDGGPGIAGGAGADIGGDGGDGGWIDTGPTIIPGTNGLNLGGGGGGETKGVGTQHSGGLGKVIISLSTLG